MCALELDPSNGIGEKKLATLSVSWLKDASLVNFDRNSAGNGAYVSIFYWSIS